MNELAALMAPRFEAEGYTLPNLRISVGFPLGSRTAIGQCFHPNYSQDKSYELFISPVLDVDDVVHVLVHELAHTVTFGDGHKGAFTKLIRALGLDGKPTMTVAGKDTAWAYRLADTIKATYPHAPMGAKGGTVKITGGRVPDGATPTPKAKTRLIRVECPCCGYLIRTTEKWIETGLPSCPSGTEMEVTP